MSYTPSNWAFVNRQSPELDHCQYRHLCRVSVSPSLSIVVSGIGSTDSIILSLDAIQCDAEVDRQRFDHASGTAFMSVFTFWFSLVLSK